MRQLGETLRLSALHPLPPLLQRLLRGRVCGSAAASNGAESRRAATQRTARRRRRHAAAARAPRHEPGREGALLLFAPPQLLEQLLASPPGFFLRHLLVHLHAAVLPLPPHAPWRLGALGRRATGPHGVPRRLCRGRGGCRVEAEPRHGAIHALGPRVQRGSPGAGPRLQEDPAARWGPGRALLARPARAGIGAHRNVGVKLPLVEQVAAQGALEERPDGRDRRHVDGRAARARAGADGGGRRGNAGGGPQPAEGRAWDGRPDRASLPWGPSPARRQWSAAIVLLLPMPEVHG
mmetsp:Transcript_40928/g.127523  ORF Transcript_40928/g.127523 Transcript_40928/m.127523 type:complete len:293 (+) Transcript_40928:575-1453(+)